MEDSIYFISLKDKRKKDKAICERMDSATMVMIAN
jgi:hypothetical protein